MHSLYSEVQTQRQQNHHVAESIVSFPGRLALMSVETIINWERGQVKSNGT